MKIIKISQNVFETVQNEPIKNIDMVHLPFANMCIAFPYSFLRSSEEMIADSLKALKKKANEQGIGIKKIFEDKAEELTLSKRKIVNYCESDLYVMFNFESLEVTVKHSNPQSIDLSEQFLFKAKTVEGTSIIHINEMGSNGVWQYKTFLKLISGIIFALNNPALVIVEEGDKKRIKGTRKGSDKHSDVRYINNVKYFSSPFKGEEISRTRYNHEEGKRMYSMSSWEVRGHWRALKNGKRYGLMLM